MSGSRVQFILEEWNLGAHIATFLGSDIDFATFCQLHHDELRGELTQLIPGIRDRVTFRARAVLCEEKGEWPEAPSLSARPRPPQSTVEATAVSHKRPRSSRLPEAPVAVTAAQGKRPCFTTLPAVSTSRTFDLETALCSTGSGTFLWLKDTLEPLDRQKLTDCILEHIFARNLNVKLSSDHFVTIQSAILLKYPDEDKDTYYIPNYKDSKGKKHPAAGKLVVKFHNLRRDTKKAGLLDSDDDDEVTQSIDEDLQFLRESFEPWKKVTEAWQHTATQRLEKIQAKGLVSEYFSEFPVLKLHRGYELLLQDFNHMYGDKCPVDILDDGWTEFSKCAISALQAENTKRKNTTDDFDRDVGLMTSGSLSDAAKTVKILLNLPELLAVKTVAKQKGKGGKTWKPNALQMRDGFVTRINTVGEISSKIEQRRKLLEKWGLSLQPFVFIVGPTDLDIIGSYAVFDDVFYLLNSPLQALDVCMRAVHATHSGFPAEVADLWLLLQRVIYKLTTQFDRRSSQLPTLLRMFQ